MRLNREFEKLSLLHTVGCVVPEPLRKDSERLELWMEYVEGAIPLRAVLETGADYEAIERAFVVLRSMHDAGVTHGDALTKNFLVRDGVVYGIDLESERKHASPELFDVSLLAADISFWLGNSMSEILRTVRSGYGRVEKVAPLRGERAYFRARFGVGHEFFDHFFVNGSGQP